MELQTIDPEKHIMQHNAITSGRYDFTACQLDILFMILASLQKDDEPNKVYAIYVRDIELITGRKWDYMQLRNATEDMGSRMFSIETENSYEQLWLFQSVKYQSGKGYFNVKLSEDIRPYLFDLKNNFTVLQLKAALSCSSKYAKRLYALACQWRSIGIITMTIGELKEMLYLKDPKGKMKEQFERISDFKDKVLDIAKRQINENTDIQFDYELIKRGRSFEFIKIYIGKHKLRQLQIDFNESLELQKQIQNIVAYGIGEAVARDICKRNNYQEFEQVVAELNKQLATNKKAVKDPLAYLIGTLKRKGIYVGDN